MCGRFLAGRPDPGTPIGAELAAWEASYDGPPMKTRGEVFPTDMAPIVTYEGALKARAMVWGFPGFSFKSGARPRPLINARAETAATLKTWRSALSSRRCLVPAAGFYEWSHKGGKKSSLKLLFTLPDSDHLLMAGLWGEFDGSWPWRFSILTTAANDSISDVHDRMPVIVKDSEADNWLFGDYAALLPSRELPLARREGGC